MLADYVTAALKKQYLESMEVNNFDADDWKYKREKKSI